MNEVHGALKASIGGENFINIPPVFIEFTRESLYAFKNTKFNVSHEMIRLFLFLLPYYDTTTEGIVVLPAIYPEVEKQSLCNDVRARFEEDGVNKVVVVIHQQVIENPNLDHIYAVVICKDKRRIELRDTGISTHAIESMKGLVKALVKEIAGVGVNLVGPNPTPNGGALTRARSQRA